MVTIELTPDEPSTSSAEVQKKQRSKSAGATDVHSSDSERHSRRDDDDWETASEGEDAEGRPNGATASTSEVLTESFEDALTEEEQKQRALLQANAAKAEGNTLYGAGKYEEALDRYRNALETAPEHDETNEIRSMCHSNSAACFFQMACYKEAVQESTKALELNPTYVKALVRRAQSHEKLDNLDEALADYTKVLELDPGNKQCRANALRLEPIVAERREKLKEEMIGKLKDLGNNILGKFGMSVDNFKAVKDPNTGSYSISFQR
ncbi:hypothetical protein KP509_05G091000 [Ceratopteris richardii]|uniref:Tetratricopeptide repeat protein 1 n=1 Tax=Ceratopteris richardii TaxID=49495 RepID=A0A8T2UNZ6_CERRI|nr:hypothetical protein KP509_05G091000 [Ceratopteris richardii]